MELKDFIKETLVQIVDGVAEAREIISKKNAEINPVGGHFDQKKLEGRRWSFEEGITEIVKFDVALTNSEASGAKGGIGVFLGAFGVGSQANFDSGSSSLSRIQFQIPILLPPGKKLEH